MADRPHPRPDPNHLVWIDLEMTGLDPDRHVIIEIATLVTDADLNVLAEGPDLVVRRTEAELEAMDEWPRRQHGQSGLLERLKTATVDIAEAERQTLEFVRQWVPEGKSPLCGNSVWQDRRFLRREMPALDAYLHYRIVDVSTVKELVRRWYPGVLTLPVKKETHRALDDIRESVKELRWYREHAFVERPGRDPAPNGDTAEPPSS